MKQISVSLASAPFGNLESVVSRLETGGADMLHFDIEDGVFVPVMTLGTRILTQLRPLTRMPFDVHLMMVHPEWLLPQIVRDGADRVSVHYEACPYPRRTLRMIHEMGARAGLAFNPATPLPDLAYLRPYLSFVVILTTEPAPDDAYLPEILTKVRHGRAADTAHEIEWVVDGGINRGNIAEALACGADTLVIGRSVFQDGAIEANLRQLKQMIHPAS